MSRSKSRLPVVAISLGDPSGIGPEVTAAALGKRVVRSALVPLVFGDARVMERFPVFRRMPSCTLATLPERVMGPMRCHVSSLAARECLPGKPSLAGGKAQLDYVRAAVLAAQEGMASAICTAPVSKEQISRAGVPFMGHTELLAESFGVEVLMLMDGPRLKVALATNHLAISAVPRALSVSGLLRQLELLSSALRPSLRRKPRIAVCGLNPHAGEGGLLGVEESEVIAPAIAAARAKGIRVEGPFPADGLFSRLDPFPFDVALAMFHDQALPVVKALDFARTVNVTLGLPVPRTSPDHGVAYSIAGKGVADATPTVSALVKAAEMASALRVGR